MKRTRILIATVLVAVLGMVACEPGPTQGNPDGRSVAFIGDSIGGIIQPKLQPKLEAQYATSYQGLGGTAVWEHYDTIWRIGQPMDVYVIELGTNDANAYGCCTWPDEKRFDYMIKTIQERNPQACTVIIPPVGLNGSPWVSGLAKAASTWRKVAKTHANTFVTKWDTTARAQTTWFQQDGFHVTEGAGATALANHVVAAVQSYCPP